MIFSKNQKMKISKYRKIENFTKSKNEHFKKPIY